VDLINVSKILKAKANELSTGTHSARWYIFGSILRRCDPNDIDVLIIYERLNEPKLIRASLGTLIFPIPLHLLFMTEEEVEETQFLTRWPNLLLFPLD
jgi:hypothetical protein